MSKTVEEAADEITALFDDGFQWKDILDAIPLAMDLVEGVEGLKGPEKKAKVLKILDTMLNKVDLPGWDWLTKKGIEWVLPLVVDMLVDASKGKFSF